MKRRITRYDLIWKEALNNFLPQFLDLLFPDIHRRIDWNHPPVFLDKELRSLIRRVGGKRGRGRCVDVLVRLRHKDGTTETLLLHVEVQNQRRANYELQVLRYHAGLVFMHDEDVLTLVVLGDADPAWRPRRGVLRAPGQLHLLRFNVAKLLDWDSRWAELEANRNPFALFLMAHLKSLLPRHQRRARLHWKVHLAELLAERRIPEHERVLLFTFLDSIMLLPEPEQEEFAEVVAEREERMAPKLLSPIQEKAYLRGHEEGREEASLDLMLHLGRVRLGEPDQHVLACLREAAAADRGREVLERIQASESWTEVFPN